MHAMGEASKAVGQACMMPVIRGLPAPFHSSVRALRLPKSRLKAGIGKLLRPIPSALRSVALPKAGLSAYAPCLAAHNNQE
jgi:hypothetical protein